MSVINAINQLAMSGVYVIYGNVGGLYEKDGEYGTSHLMEHMVCHNWDDLRDTFQENGIQANAYTGFDLVVFHITGLTSRVEPLAKEFVARVTGGIRDNITEEMFETEKKTVLQEYGDTFADPVICGMLNGVRKIYGAFGPIGRRKDIENFTFEDFKRVYEEKFRKPNLVVYVGQTGINFTGLEFATGAGEIMCPPVYREDRKIELETNPGVDRTFVNCFSKMICTKEDSVALKIACRMLSNGLNSPLYQEIREKRGLSYYSIGDIERMGSVVVPLFCSATDKDKAGELISVYDMVFGDLDKYLTEERFNICLNFAKVIREKHLVLRYENYDDFIVKALGYAVDDDELETLTLDRVKEVAFRYLSLPQICKYTN